VFLLLLLLFVSPPSPAKALTFMADFSVNGSLLRSAYSHGTSVLGVHSISPRSSSLFLSFFSLLPKKKKTGPRNSIELAYI
jgi:hypothetical protein